MVMPPLRREAQFNECVKRSSDRRTYQFRLQVSATSPATYTRHHSQPEGKSDSGVPAERLPNGNIISVRAVECEALLCPEKPQFIPQTVIFCDSAMASPVTIHQILCSFSPQADAATPRLLS